MASVGRKLTQKLDKLPWNPKKKSSVGRGEAYLVHVSLSCAGSFPSACHNVTVLLCLTHMRTFYFYLGKANIERLFI